MRTAARTRTCPHCDGTGTMNSEGTIIPGFCPPCGSRGTLTDAEWEAARQDGWCMNPEDWDEPDALESS